MIERPKSARSSKPVWQPSTGRRMMPQLVLLLAGLSACSTQHVSYPIPPAECSKRVPASLLKDVQGWPLPATDAPRDWMAFGVGESGQRVQANQRGAVILEIVTACEGREREIYDTLTKRKKVLGIF